MNMKKITTAVVFVFSANLASASGIPVVDVAGNALKITHQAESILKFVEQIEQLKAQLEQQKQMFASMNGIRGMGQLLNNPAARQYLPANSQEMYNLAVGVQSGKYSGLSGSLKAIRDAGRIVSTSSVKNTATAGALDKAQTQLAAMQASAEAAFNAAGDRFERLEQLVQAVDTAADPKAAADLQNRIQAEQVMMQNEQSKLSMMVQLQSIQRQQLEQQGREQKAKFGQGGQAVYVTGY